MGFSGEGRGREPAGYHDIYRKSRFEVSIAGITATIRKTQAVLVARPTEVA